MRPGLLINHTDVYVRLERVHVLAQGHVHIVRDFRLGMDGGVVMNAAGVDQHKPGVVAQVVECTDKAGDVLGRYAQASDLVHELAELRPSLGFDGVTVLCLSSQHLIFDVGQVALLDQKITEVLGLVNGLEALDAGGVEGTGADIKLQVELGLMLGFCAFVSADVKICGVIAVVMHDSTHSLYSFHRCMWWVDSVSGNDPSGLFAQPHSCGCGLQKCGCPETLRPSEAASFQNEERHGSGRGTAGVRFEEGNRWNNN